jgi:hypothetical protein
VIEFDLKSILVRGVDLEVSKMIQEAGDLSKQECDASAAWSSWRPHYQPDRRCDKVIG